MAPPKVFIKKAFIPNSPALKVASFTNIPTKNDTTQSSIVPPNMVVNPAAPIAEKIRFVLKSYLGQFSFISINFSKTSSREYFSV